MGFAEARAPLGPILHVMACAEGGNLHRLVQGELSSQDTLTVMDHVRTCGECRERLAFVSRSAPTRSLVEGASLRYRHYSAREIEESRSQGGRGKKVGIFAVFMIVLLTGIGRMNGREKVVKPDDPDVICRRELTHGRPFLQWPRGEIKTRPRAFALALPPGTKAVRIAVEHSEGVLYQRTFQEGEPGVIMDLVQGEAPDGAYDALRTFLPFPGLEELPLEIQTPYRVRAWIGEAPGAPTTFFLAE